MPLRCRDSCFQRVMSLTASCLPRMWVAGLREARTIKPVGCKRRDDGRLAVFGAAPLWAKRGPLSVKRATKANAATPTISHHDRRTLPQAVAMDYKTQTHRYTPQWIKQSFLTRLLRALWKERASVHASPGG